MRVCKALIMLATIGRGCALTGQTVRVLSETGKAPVPFANVLLTAAGGKQLLVTDTNGVAVVKNNLSQHCHIDISCTGFRRFSDSLLLNKDYIFYLKPLANNLDEIVVTGQYSPGTAESAVQQVSIIDRKKMDNMAAVTLRDVLTNQLNIRLEQDNILGSSMDLQGISGQNVKLLIDGVPMIGRQNGNIDLSQVNLNNIERIEVIQGPMSVSYGTNALAGTINLITKKSMQRHCEGNISSYYESIGNYNLNGRLGFHYTKSTLAISGGRNFFDGWSPHEKFSPIRKSQPADSGRYQQWKPREQYFGELQYIYRLKRLSLNYKGSYFNEMIANKGYPLSPYGENAFDDYYHTLREDNAVFLNGDAGKNKHLNFQAAWNNYKRIKNTYYKDLTDLSQSLTTNGGDQDTTRSRLLSSRATLSTKNADSKINGELGYDVNYETAYGSMIRNRYQQMGDYALFTSAEYKPMNRITVRPGLRYAYNTRYNAPLVPSLNLKYDLPKSFVLRFSYARGFRAPSLQELYFYFVDINHNIIGNPDLKAEQSHNFNLSLSCNTKKGSVLLKTESALFYNYIQNLITLAQGVGTQYSYMNVGLYKTHGAQFNSELTWRQFKLSLGASYIGRYNQLSEEYKVTSFSYSPEIRSSLWYEIKRLHLSVAVFYKYNGRLPGFTTTADNQVQPTFISAYNIADLTVSKSFFHNKIKLSVGSKNLFNITSVNSYAAGSVHSSAGNSSPMACGRTYFIKLDFSLQSKK